MYRELSSLICIGLGFVFGCLACALVNDDRRKHTGGSFLESYNDNKGDGFECE